MGNIRFGKSTRFLVPSNPIDNVVSLCIWGDGPGRPFDNRYTLLTKELIEKHIHLTFDDGEECDIFDPSEILVLPNRVTIMNARRILWKYYYYGEPKSDKTLISISYEWIENGYVRIDEKGQDQTTRMIQAKSHPAFVCVGDIWLFLHDNTT